MTTEKTSPSAVGARELVKHFPIRMGLGRKTILNGLSFEISRGSTVGLVGPNGSGKSTLQKILAGVERPSSGQLEVLGGSLGEAAVRARIGYVPEDSPFPGELSARAALQLIGALYGMKAAALRELGTRRLEQVGLADHMNKPLRRYSRGMLRRFALAQAWLHEPDLILLDEPTAGLDGQGFDVLTELLDEARSRGTTVVFSSHLMSDLFDHCSEVYVLLNGRFAAQGAPEELLSRPGCWRIEAHGLSQGTLEQLDVWISDNGGEVQRITPAGKSLFDLYHDASLAD